MKFTYTAKNANGKTATGTVEAASKLAAADQLFNEQKLTVVKLEQVADETKAAPAKTGLNLDEGTRIHIGKAEKYTSKKALEDAKPKKIKSLKEAMDWANDWVIEQSSVPLKQKALFFRMLAVMINAGLPLVKSLKILCDQIEHPKLKHILKEVSAKVDKGNSFSTTLKEYPDTFRESEIGIIAAGETSGQMNKTLTSLATTLEKNADMKSKTKSAMIYPVAILTILVGVMIVVMTLVVPKLSELFSGAGVNLPKSTQILIGMSNWFTSSTLLLPNWILFLLLIAGVVSITRKIKKTANGKYMWDKAMLHAPIFGVLHEKIAIASFTRLLSSLTSAGISIIRSLEISANAMENEVYRRRLREVRTEVEQGVSIHESIANDPLFPALVVSLIAVGEQTAQLDTVTEKIAIVYDDEVETFIKNLTTIMEPLIIVVVGVLVGGLMVAIMQPITQIADVVSQS